MAFMNKFTILFIAISISFVIYVHNMQVVRDYNDDNEAIDIFSIDTLAQVIPQSTLSLESIEETNVAIKKIEDDDSVNIISSGSSAVATSQYKSSLESNEKNDGDPIVSKAAVDGAMSDENDSNQDEILKDFLYEEYIPASVEEYIVNNLDRLGYNNASDPSGCLIWNDTDATNATIHAKLTSYAEDLERYKKAIKEHEQVPDLHKVIKKTNNHDICALTRPHPDGIKALFPSKEISFSSSGYVEPLTPPMRYHKICNDFDKNLMSLDYLVHDFESMCQKLKPTSRMVFLDLGASLSFHQEQKGDHAEIESPALTLLNLYEKFGFEFDHIYAFESSFTEPKRVYEELLPQKYFAKYHWINLGITGGRDHKMNPFHSILKSFDEDDFIVVKLDVDQYRTESSILRQLIEDKDGAYHKLIDQFYFEHHVHIWELRKSWGLMKGTIKDSFESFSKLRKSGIPAHFWP